MCHNGAKFTAAALDEMITTLKEDGYEFVKISDLIYKDNYEINHEGRQIPVGKKEEASTEEQTTKKTAKNTTKKTTTVTN